MAGRGSGTVTILFSDLVDSTGLSIRLGDEVAQGLRRAHDRILSREFERYGGTVVKGTGDGFMVAFDSAREAIECAVAAQQSIASQQAEGRYLELQVRIGVHTGEPVWDGDDLYGADVNLAARIAEEAEGGQVLVSDVTHLLAQRSVDAQSVSAGRRVLKGFEEPVSLFNIRWQESRVRVPHLSRFVGRGEERDRLRQRLTASLRGRGSVVFVSGEPGIGKTRLVSEMAIEALDRGCLVLNGRAYESEGMPPYLPFVEALAECVRAVPPPELLQALRGNGAYVARALPEVRHLVQDTVDISALSPDADRYRLFEGFSDFFVSVSASSPLFIFLDDMHWADRATILLFRHLAGRLKAAPVMVVGTYRETDISEEHALALLVEELKRNGLAERLSLLPFDRGQAAALVEAVAGGRAASGVSSGLYAIAEGNPFFTEELVRHLQEQGHDLTEATASLEGWPIPQGLRQVVLKRLSRLGEKANELLAHSSVLGRRLAPSEVVTLTGEDEGSVLGLLDRAVEAGVVREEGEGFVYAHPLIQETLYRGLTRARRRHLHRCSGEALESLYAADTGPHLARLAHHFYEAATEGGAGAEKAASYAERAAERALSVSAYEEAAGHYGRALHVLEAAGDTDESRRCEILLGLGGAQAKAGEGAAAGETFRRAAALAGTLELPEALARAALGFGEVRRSAGFVDEPLLNLLKEGLDALGDEPSALRAMLLARFAVALYHAAPHAQLMTVSREAVEVARQVGDPATLVYVLSTTHFFLHETDDIEGRLSAVDEIVRMAEAIGDREKALEARRDRMVDLLEVGDIETFDRELAIYSRRAEELRQPFFLWRAAVCRSMRAILDGRFEEAERMAQESLVIGREVQSETEHPTQILGIQMFMLRREQGRLGELESTVRTFIDQFSAGPWRGALAFMHCELGHDEEAETEFQRLASSGFEDVPRDFNWSIGLTLLSETCAYLGDAKRAATLYQMLAPYRGRNVTVADTAVCVGSVSRSLGMLAATMGRWEDAERHFEDALEMNQRLGAAPLVAHTQQEFAEALLSRNRAGDEQRAVALLKRALSTASELGMTRLAEKAAALLLRAGAGYGGAGGEVDEI